MSFRVFHICLFTIAIAGPACRSSSPSEPAAPSADAAFDQLAREYLEAYGKLMILKLRDDYRAQQYSLQQFHDTFIGLGPLPLLLIRKAMLGESGQLFPNIPAR